MKKYIKNYIKEIDSILENNKKQDEEIIKEHLIKIGFFQHERLIHLLVTLFYALFVFIFFAFTCFLSIMFIIIVLILLVFLVFYISHYFFLENGVQYMYKQYDKLRNLIK